MSIEDLFKGSNKGCWYDPSSYIIDRKGDAHLLNKARKITLWRKLKARLGFKEKDTLFSKMENSPKMYYDIDSFRLRNELDAVWALYENLNQYIKKFKWNDVREVRPEEGQRVIAWEDYRLIGKTYQGADLYYYRSKYGFVYRPDDTDGYGAITHWMSLPFSEGPGVEEKDLDFSYFFPLKDENEG